MMMDGDEEYDGQEDDTYHSASSGPSQLERRREEMNNLFGIRPWKSHITRRRLEDRSPEVRALYAAQNRPPRRKAEKTIVSIGNLIWVVFVGWWLAGLYVLMAGLMLALCSKGYAVFCWDMASYYLWPFGKFVVRLKREHLTVDVDEEDDVRSTNLPHAHLHQARNVHGVASKGIFFTLAAIILVPFHLLVMLLCWFSIFFIPMAKVNFEGIKMLFREPLEVQPSHEYVGAKILLCVFQASNIYYYKYSVMGMNIVLVNLLPFVFVSLFLGYIVPFFWTPPSYLIFASSVLSIIPMAYYIGMAISSVSAQSNYAVGAALNATMGSIIEMILYIAALNEGGLQDLVMAGIIGSIFGELLLLPGLSMVAGGLKFQEQQFSVVVAGVSSVLLITSVIGISLPTVFYEIYGGLTFDCTSCDVYPSGGNTSNVSTFISHSGRTILRNLGASSPVLSCSGCNMFEADLDNDPVFGDKTKPLMFCVAAILPIAYFVGLWFTLKTHSHIFDKKEGEEEARHDAPEWGRFKSLLVLFVCTVLFALIAEDLIKSIEPTLTAIGISQTFAGLTIVALVPNTAEFVNAIAFALQGNVALSLEIGFSGALQICLIQIPVLVWVSLIMSGYSINHSFLLLFPVMDVFAMIMSVIIVNYLTTEGRANYFKGCSLVIIYALFVSAHYFIPKDQTLYS